MTPLRCSHVWKGTGSPTSAGKDQGQEAEGGLSPGQTSPGFRRVSGASCMSALAGKKLWVLLMPRAFRQLEAQIHLIPAPCGSARSEPAGVCIQERERQLVQVSPEKWDTSHHARGSALSLPRAGAIKLLPLVTCQQEPAGRVRPLEAAARAQGSVSAAVPPGDDAGLSAEPPRRWAHRGGQAAPPAQGPPGSQDADPGGSQQTAGIAAAQAEAAAGAGEASGISSGFLKSNFPNRVWSVINNENIPRNHVCRSKSEKCTNCFTGCKWEYGIRFQCSYLVFFLVLFIIKMHWLHGWIYLRTGWKLCVFMV